MSIENNRKTAFSSPRCPLEVRDIRQGNLQEFKGITCENELGRFGGGIECQEFCEFTICIEVIEPIASTEV